VAKDMATAERLFLKEYPGTVILEIKLHSEYVIVDGGRDEDNTNN
jgi:hypothetical protein